MAELDHYVGIVLDKLDELGIADNTIVVFSTDNGAEVFSWPDGGTIPFRGEKGTTWEGGFRVPQVVRWPGVIEPGTVYNDIMSHEDWLPTFLAAAGDPDIKDKLLTGHQAGDKNFRTHLDGYDFMPYFSGETDKGPRREIFYFDAAGNLNALRVDDWKASFSYNEGDISTAFRVSPSWPIITNLRMDPFERGYFESKFYMRWMADQMWTFVPAQAFVEEFLSTFVEYPPSQAVGSLSVDQVLERLKAAQTRGGG
jgi:arylsulfatase